MQFDTNGRQAGALGGRVLQATAGFVLRACEAGLGPRHHRCGSARRDLAGRNGFPVHHRVVAAQVPERGGPLW